MTLNYKDIESEVKKLAAKIQSARSSSDEVFKQAASYLNFLNKTIESLINHSKPKIKKTKLDLEVLALKLELQLVDALIERKAKEENEKTDGDGAEDKKKGDQRSPS